MNYLNILISQFDGEKECYICYNLLNIFVEFCYLIRKIEEVKLYFGILDVKKGNINLIYLSIFCLMIYNNIEYNLFN